MKKLNNNIKFLYFMIICFLFIKFLSVINIIPKIAIINPIFWLIIFILGIFMTTDDYNHFFNKREKIEVIIIILFIYLIIYFSLGLIFGYSYNVYNNTNINLIIKNIYFYIMPIVFQEYIRGVLCNYSNKSFNIRVLIGVLFILINLNLYSLSNMFNNGEIFLKVICSNLIPLIILEFVLTYLDFIGGYSLSLTYKLFVTLFTVFIPIIPNLNFFLNGIINTSIPVIVYIIIDRYNEIDNSKIYREYGKNSCLGYAPILILIVYTVLNFMGVLKYQAISILSNSMNPLYYMGDTVIIEKLSDNKKKELNVGDIIAYYDKEQNIIVHRIINKLNKDGEIIFITKGDNNQNRDNILVKLSDIKGKYLFHVKYLGYPKMVIYQILNNKKE